MEWSVAKIGIAMFDALHTYGLAVLLATASGQPVEVKDAGLIYTLSSPESTVPYAASHILDCLLVLPGRDNLLTMANHQPKYPSPVATLDGLLAALFTSPGSSTPSVHGLLSKQRLDSSAVQQGLLKVTKRIHHWKEYVGRLQRGASNWLADVLQDYDLTNPTVPVLTEGQPKKDLHVLMTMDPSLGYSYRRPLSDGHMTKKTNLAIRGPRYAALLALLGASRFLRAQPLGGHLVNFYVPLPRHLVIDASTSLPILALVACAPDQAIIWRWLALSSTEQQPAATWHGLAYQTLQRQPQQQAIALGSGVLENRWLTKMTEQIGQGIISFWRGWLDRQGRSTLDEQGHLVDCLKQRRMEA